MASAHEVLEKFYDTVIKRDLAAARKYLSDDLVFVGLFETYRGPEQYLASLTQLLSITVRLTPKTIIGEGKEAAIFFDLETKAPAAAKTLVAEWHQIQNGRIFHVESAFDGRPFAGMFTPKK